MENYRLSRYGIWTYKERTLKLFSGKWFKNYLQIWGHIWELAKLATSKSGWWFFSLISGTALRAIIGGIQLRLYAAFISQAP